MPDHSGGNGGDADHRGCLPCLTLSTLNGRLVFWDPLTTHEEQRGRQSTAALCHTRCHSLDYFLKCEGREKLLRNLNPLRRRRSLLVLRPLRPTPRSADAMEHILQEITAVGRCLEAMDSKISDLSTASTSIRADIACFQVTVTDLDHRLKTVEDRFATLPEQDTELQFLRAKITDLEDRIWRDNVSFFGIPEHKEGTDVKAFLKDFLPELTSLTFSHAVGVSKGPQNRSSA
ncbi:hypothetical protein NDU88_003443 [Pleurodeles waltl]|uniref:Uncharacterized protein n=1 Tax=Pleurodeles waltl TaxID=8319 RepID=A0AAV7UYG4_PLEWA|nr:hypothetical protein NDU88_003443 [Pleurodeles waltl]